MHRAELHKSRLAEKSWLCSDSIFASPCRLTATAEVQVGVRSRLP